MRLFSYISIAIVIAFLLLKSCKSDQIVYPAPDSISILTDTTKKQLSKAISFAGSREIKGIPYELRQIEDLMITDDHFVIYDSDRATQEKIYQIDKKSGEFIREFRVPKQARRRKFWSKECML